MKVIFVGDARSGKTRCIQELCRGILLDTPYTPTLGVEITPYGKFNFWDCAGDPRFSGLKEGYYIKAEIAFVFVHSWNKGAFETHAKAIKEVCPDIPIYKIVDGDTPFISFVLSLY